MPKVTITNTDGTTTEVTVSDAAAREFEDLPFEADHIQEVVVTRDK